MQTPPFVTFGCPNFPPHPLGSSTFILGTSAEGALDGDDAFQQIHDPQHQCHAEAEAGIAKFAGVRQVLVERIKKRMQTKAVICVPESNL